MMKILSILLFFLPLLITAQSALEKVENLNLNSLNTKIKTYYSSGFESEAENLENLLKVSGKFFESEFGINETFSIALLNKNDWQKISKIPYGLPFVSGPPYIVCIPADSKNELGKLVDAALTKSNLDKKYKLANDKIALQFISFIGFHELGHIYAKESGLSFPNKWTYEFLATYFAYLYLENTAPDKNKLWLDIGNLLLKDIKPNHTSLNDFENLYVRVGIANYAWYQVVFLKRVAEVASRMDSNFVFKLKNESLKESDDLSLTQLENIENGFLDWARNYKLLK